METPKSHYTPNTLYTPRQLTRLGRPAPRARRLRPLLRCAAVGLAALLAMAACTDGPSGTERATGSTTAAGSGTAQPSVSSQLEGDYERVVRNVLPSVVQITTSSGLGSGIVYDDKGDIVTNAHVVGSDRAFQVALANSGSTLDAALVGSYPPGDLAVIRLRKAPPGLHPATFADSGRVQVGQLVLAMGNPLGLNSSVTQGIVSAVGRTVSEPAGGGSPGATIPNMVQTSAAINPGNSGGALANLSSQVIGINTLAAVDRELGGGAAPGIGFAIPSSTVTRIADQLISSGKVTNSGRAALGVTVRTVLGPDFSPAGAGIVAVTSDGPAAKAGLQPGDVITKLGTTGIADAQALTEALAVLKPGDKIQVGYERNGRAQTADVTLGTLAGP